MPRRRSPETITSLSRFVAAINRIGKDTPDMDGFEVIERTSNGRRGDGASITIYKNYPSIGISRAAYTLLGSRHVQLLFNPTTRCIGIRPVTDQVNGFYTVAGTKSNPRLSCTQLFKKYQLDMQALAGQYPVQLNGDMLIVQLPPAESE